MRTYQRTHPWLTFQIDLRNAPPSLWITLGECQSKCEHIAGVPLQPDTAQQLHTIYLVKGVLATTAIEGNTLSEAEVLQHLEGKLKLPPSREYLAQEVQNVIGACNMIVGEVKSGTQPPLTPGRIKTLNGLVLDKLTHESEVVPGKFRKHEVGVARYKAAPAEDCDYLVDRLCEWLNGESFEAPQGMSVVYAILKAVLAHLYLAWIHPFGDGNGRTARLVEFQILIESGVPTPAAHLLSNHYNQTRTEYYRLLDHSSRSGGDTLPFLLYALQGFRDELRSQLGVIRRQQLDVAWENYVHDAFKNKTSPTNVRRRHLVLDLSESEEQVPLAKVGAISARVAAAYARKTRKALSRDLNALVRMGLIEKSRAGVRARKELILAFLPTTAKDPG